MVTIFVLNKLSLLMKATVSYQAVTCTYHLTTLAFVMERIMALQQMIDEKNTFLFI